MARLIQSRLMVFAILGLPSFSSHAVAAENATPPQLKVGFAERDISPAIGMEQAGGYTKAYFKSFHDACKVRAAVFDDGQKRVALVGIDALVIRRQTVEAARTLIHKQCGIEPTAVLIAASHSHSSGPTGMVLPGEYDHGSPLVQKLAYEGSSTADPKYLEHVERQVAKAVWEADRKRVPARCGIGRGVEDGVAFNRRFRMRHGLTTTHPRPGNPHILEPAGPTDPEVGVIGAWDEQDRFLGCVVNFACHATANPARDAISANYVYYLEKAIRGYMGDDTVVVFLNGASGDITQVDNLSKYANRDAERWSQFVGGRIGAEALKVLLTMAHGDLTPVDYQVKMLSIKRRVPHPERVAHSLKAAQKNPDKPGLNEWIWAKEIVLLAAKLNREPLAEVEIQAVQIGPAVFVTSPAEYFCQYGLDIKAGSPFPFTLPVSLANGCVGYVPTQEAFGPRGGGYETRLTSYSNLEPTAGQQMAEAGLELAREMKPGAAPRHPPARPFGHNPWTYRNVPPELD